MAQETITRAYLTKAIAEETGLSSTEAAKIIDLLFEEMINIVKTDNYLKIASFGSFFIRSKSERIGRNPKTKVPAKIEARRVISFNPSRKLRSNVNTNLAE